MIQPVTHVSPLHPVDLDGLPEYPEALIDVPPATDYFIRFYHTRWLASELHLKASMAVQGMALNLFWLARNQNPMGSLPVDPMLLQRLLRVTEHQWRDAMAEVVTPLHGWRQMRAGEKVVLGHEVVITESLDALNKRAARAASNEEKAVASRCRRLAADLKEMGREYAQVAQDGAKVAWLDDWIARNRPGQRRKPQVFGMIEAALVAGSREGRI